MSCINQLSYQYAHFFFDCCLVILLDEGESALALASALALTLARVLLAIALWLAELSSFESCEDIADPLPSVS